jgi:hypothetical protein
VAGNMVRDGFFKNIGHSGGARVKARV